MSSTEVEMSRTEVEMMRSWTGVGMRRVGWWLG